MKKIKILESGGSAKEFTKTINKHLKKGWIISGNVFRGHECLTVVLFKN